MPRKHNPNENKSGSLQPLRVVRQSGLPVLLTHLKAYSAEYATIFDKIQAKLGVDDKTALTQEQAARFQKLLDRCDRLLRRYYPCEAAWPFLSYTQLRKRVREYEANIIVSIEKTSGHLVYIIADEDAAMAKAMEDQISPGTAGLGYTMK